MRAVTFTDPWEFAPLAEPVLARQPAAYNVLASRLAERTAGQPALPDELWLLVVGDTGPVAAAVHTPPFSVFTGPVEGEVGSAATALVTALAGRRLPGVTGEATIGTAFAETWQRTTGISARVAMTEVMYDLAAAPDAPPVPGSSRPATEADLGLLNRWLNDFHAEAVPDEPWPGGEDLARRQLASRTMLFWQDERGLPVSMAGVTRPVAGVARVGPVYTPAEHRRHGYAAALTAAAATRGFTAGATRVTLYADVANAASNGVYRRLGFRPIGEALLYTFG